MALKLFIKQSGFTYGKSELQGERIHLPFLRNPESGFPNREVKVNVLRTLYVDTKIHDKCIGRKTALSFQEAIS